MITAALFAVTFLLGLVFGWQSRRRQPAVPTTRSETMLAIEFARTLDDPFEVQTFLTEWTHGAADTDEWADWQEFLRTNLEGIHA